MIERIRIPINIPKVALAGEYAVPFGIVDHNFAKALICQGLAELTGGTMDDLPAPKARPRKGGDQDGPQQRPPGGVRRATEATESPPELRDSG